MTFRVGGDYGVYSEGDFNLGFPEPQGSEQEPQGTRVRLKGALGCSFWLHQECFAIDLLYIYFIIYLFYIWLLPCGYQQLWGSISA